MRRLLIAGLILMLSISLSGTAIGDVEIYVDKSDWDIALGGQFETEDFTDEILNDGISYVSSESGNINTAFGYYHDVLMSESQNAAMTIWSFASPINAFGGTWTLGGPGGSGNYLMVYMNSLETENLVGVVSSDYNGDFWGFISDTQVETVWLVGGGGTNQQSYKLDDMVYSPPISSE
jgi:hypothetical protein